MKVRWTRDSIRLRLTPDELAALAARQPVRETLAFPGGLAWQVELAPAPGATCLHTDGTGAADGIAAADGTAHRAVIALSHGDIERLAAPATEGVYFQTTGALRYSIEKDFPCIHPRPAAAGEPATATFDPPPGFAERKA